MNYLWHFSLPDVRWALIKHIDALPKCKDTATAPLLPAINQHTRQSVPYICLSNTPNLDVLEMYHIVRKCHMYIARSIH